MLFLRGGRYEKVLIDKPVAADKPFHFRSTDIKSLGSGEYSLAFWMRVDDWTDRYGQAKLIATRSPQHRLKLNYKLTPDVSQLKHLNSRPNLSHSNPGIWLSPEANELVVVISTLKNENGAIGIQQDNNMFHKTQEQFSNIRCKVQIPLQSYVHVVVTLWNRTVDIWLNGALAKTCLLPNASIPFGDFDLWVGTGVEKNNSSGTYAAPRTNNLFESGFNGKIAKMKFYNRALTSSEVRGLYNESPV